jgi:hypothetical protein
VSRVIILFNLSHLTPGVASHLLFHISVSPVIIFFITFIWVIYNYIQSNLVITTSIYVTPGLYIRP